MSRVIVIQADDEDDSRLNAVLDQLAGGPPATEPPTGSPSGPKQPYSVVESLAKGAEAAYASLLKGQEAASQPPRIPIAPRVQPAAFALQDYHPSPVAATAARPPDDPPIPLQDYDPSPTQPVATQVEPVVDWSKAAPDPSWADAMAARWATALVDAMAKQRPPVARFRPRAADTNRDNDLLDELFNPTDPRDREPTYRFASQEGESKADAVATGGGQWHKLADRDGVSKAEALKGSGAIPTAFGYEFKPKAGFPMAERVADETPPVAYAAGVDPEAQEQLNAQWRAKQERQQQEREAEAKRRAEERDAASRQQGNTVFGYGNLARSVAQGGMNTGTGLAQGLAQLNNAGALGTMAAGFGPMVMGIGAAVDAGTQMIAGAFRGMKEMAEMGGKAIKQVASNDGFGLLQTGVEATAKSFEKLPLVGGMVADGLRALVAPVGMFKAAMDAFTGRAKELSGLDPRIATAQAMADARRQFTDLREAQQMGARYAKLVEQQERLERTFSDLLMPIKEVIADTLSDVADLLRMILPAAQTGAEAAEGSRSLIAAAVDFYSGLAPGLKDMLDRARANRQNEASVAAASALGELEDLLRGLPPIVAPAPAGNGGWARPPVQVPVVLNPLR